MLRAALLCFTLAPLAAQNALMINAAIDEAAADFAEDFIVRFSGGRNVAVIGLETDKPKLMVHFIDTMVSALKDAGAGRLVVVDRQRLEVLQTELDFSLTGKVSENTEQRIGHFTGADTLIYGELKSGLVMTIRAAATETGQILSQKTYDLSGRTRFWTAGVSAGTSFSRPLAIGTLHGTLALLPNSFLEIGVDAGFFSRKADESYYSVIPFAHYAFFMPFDKGGLYAGAGIGYMFGSISYQDEREADPVRIITADAIIGVNLFNFLDVSYTLRTTFKAVTNKFSAGFTYRFK
jgi:hypothetical protein